MGFGMSKTIDQNMNKQHVLMTANAKTQVERQIIMQNEIRKQQLALQIAWSREFIKYFGSFFALAAVGCTAGAIKRRKPAIFAPMVPLSFIMTYQWDMAHGSYIQRMREDAEGIMKNEADRLNFPHGPLTFEMIEKERRAQCHLPPLPEK